jgi:hypothetical protein
MSSFFLCVLSASVANSAFAICVHPCPICGCKKSDSSAFLRDWPGALRGSDSWSAARDVTVEDGSMVRRARRMFNGAKATKAAKPLLAVVANTWPGERLGQFSREPMRESDIESCKTNPKSEQRRSAGAHALACPSFYRSALDLSALDLSPAERNGLSSYDDHRAPNLTKLPPRSSASVRDHAQVCDVRIVAGVVREQRCIVAERGSGDPSVAGFDRLAHASPIGGHARPCVR